MSISCQQLKDLIIIPTISAIGLYSPDALQLLVGTAAQETQLGTYIAQIGIGTNGGLGIYQCEKPTYNDIWDNVVQNNVAMRAKIKLYLGYDGKPSHLRLISDIALATVIARLHYYRVGESLPSGKNVEAMARYWKKYYNTRLGKGTEEQFIQNYDKYIR
jgi:hypothetical protein